jgi:putative flippase GtrA
LDLTTKQSLLEKINTEKSILVKFASVGVLATLIHALIYSLCLATSLAQPQLANLTAYAVALIFSYIGQRGWTFSHIENSNAGSTKAKFILSSFLGYTLNAVWIAMVARVWELPAYYALIGILFVSPACTYVLLKFWVFVDRQ